MSSRRSTPRKTLVVLGISAAAGIALLCLSPRLRSVLSSGDSLKPIAATALSLDERKVVRLTYVVERDGGHAVQVRLGEGAEFDQARHEFSRRLTAKITSAMAGASPRELSRFTLSTDPSGHAVLLGFFEAALEPYSMREGVVEVEVIGADPELDTQLCPCMLEVVKISDL